MNFLVGVSVERKYISKIGKLEDSEWKFIYIYIFFQAFMSWTILI